jgi:DNA transformation protein and related proteins
MSQDGFAAHCVELLSAAGTARARRMFGGHGLYVDERFVAVIVEDGLYLKANAETRARFEAAGCRQWVYHGGRAPVAMPYWSAPEEAMDSPGAMRPWALLAMQAATVKPVAKAAKKSTRKVAAKPPLKPPRP